MDDAEFEELPEIVPSWLRLQNATTLRKRLLAAGYMPLPCNGKAPPIAGWQHIVTTNPLIDTWERYYPQATNTGVLTEINPTVDIDIMHPEAAAAIEALARERFEEHGYILTRFGKAPKRAIVLRTNEPFNKITRLFIAPDGSTQKIEILATGQQVVVAGIHPDTKRDYSWHGGMPGEIKREDLPYVREADMHSFMDAAATLLINEFGFKTKDSSKQRKANGGEQPQPNNPEAGLREKAYAEAALEGCVKDLAAAASGSRNELLNKLAFRLGRMVVRGWISRAEVEAALIGAMHANGAVADDGLAAAEATLRSGLDAGMAEPYPDLREETPAAPEAPPQHHSPRTLDQVHDVFKKWLGDEYDIAVLDAMLAVAAAERLLGDPAWLLIISGPGNAKTETVQAVSGLGAQIVSTLSSDAALLSASPRKQRIKTATGGLLRKIGDRGILVIKDFTSILSTGREIRGSILAALREIHDGQWVRNVGTDGGQTLTWKGRIVVLGACTTAWDQAHAVISTMGDRFVLIRSDSHIGRVSSGLRAMHNIGKEVMMREEMSAAVAGLVSSINADAAYTLNDDDLKTIVRAANLVTLARTGVELDYRGNVIDAHDPEMPTRFGKQLKQIMRGAIAVGMGRLDALQLAIRCAQDSMPRLRLAILRDLAANPRSRIVDIRRRLQKPRATADRTLQALHTLGLLICDEEEIERDGKTEYVRRYSLAAGVSLDVLSNPDAAASLL